MAKKRARTDAEHAADIVQSSRIKWLLTLPEAEKLVLEGIKLGRELAKTTVSKGPGEPDGDRE